jgi:hypothetical protein
MGGFWPFNLTDFHQDLQEQRQIPNPDKPEPTGTQRKFK